MLRSPNLYNLCQMENIKVVSDPCVESYNLHVPPLDELAHVIECGLKENFGNALVQVVDCPDLTQEPFHLSAPGLCGEPSLVDLGGVPYLVPSVQRDKIYDLAQIPALIEWKDSSSAMIIGAGAGPWFHAGSNCELMANLSIGQAGDGLCSSVTNMTRIALLDKVGQRLLQTLPQTETKCALLSNLLVCHGQRGPVLHVTCSQRTGAENFISCIRKTLNKHYSSGQVIGLAGAFIIDEGQAKLHIMPDFSPCPLQSDADVDQWLHFYHANSPLIALSVSVSQDPGLDLRIEHTHCFSLHGDGGHYHNDVTPQSIKYSGYFIPAEKIYRIDRPGKTHNIGRD